VPGATAALLGTEYAATTDPAGRFVLRIPPTAEVWTVGISHPWWASTAPVYDLTVHRNDTSPGRCVA
jgi:hypothetical protein